MSAPEPVPDDVLVRFVREILRNAGKDGLSQGQITEACREFEQLNRSPVVTGLWDQGLVDLTWDCASGDILIHLRDTAVFADVIDAAQRDYLRRASARAEED